MTTFKQKYELITSFYESHWDKFRHFIENKEIKYFLEESIKYYYGDPKTQSQEGWK
jgi:hypothetical protein